MGLSGRAELLNLRPAGQIWLVVQCSFGQWGSPWIQKFGSRVVVALLLDLWALHTCSGAQSQCTEPDQDSPRSHDPIPR